MAYRDTGLDTLSICNGELLLYNKATIMGLLTLKGRPRQWRRCTATLEILYKLKKEILKSENEDLVSQIDHAIMKTYKDQLVFSFIGHYSAGKSSLINHMLNQEILPSSPVPTTSNTVSVEIGDSEEIKGFRRPVPDRLPGHPGCGLPDGQPSCHHRLPEGLG